ncbi:MAG: DUF4240 domain-containing protein [Bacteroidia bacterium]|nr:DUF4240 domain-containing protein [Bacteroidia bacterium]
MIAEKEFWNLVELTRHRAGGSVENQVALIEAELYKKEPTAIVGFLNVFTLSCAGAIPPKFGGPVT